MAKSRACPTGLRAFRIPVLTNPPMYEVAMGLAQPERATMKVCARDKAHALDLIEMGHGERVPTRGG